MHCLRCGNTEERYFFKDAIGWYCRKCIMFGRMEPGKLPAPKKTERKVMHVDYQLKYPLTPAQRKCAMQIVEYVKHHQDVLVYAACGAGKTELVMETIKQALSLGKKVGFAISRRQVVLEIKDRMQLAFPTLKVVAVCEGYTEITEGDLIICTMHQLYRYHQTFGEKVYLTATPDEEMLENVRLGNLAMVELFQRPHGYPLIVPDVIAGAPFIQTLLLLRFLFVQKKEKAQTLVFVPTIQMAESLNFWLRFLFRSISFTSKTKDKEIILKKFHEKKYECLIATTVLERGITIKGVHVVIFHADHIVFQEASLIQMIGRVGRNIEMPTGKGLFLCTRKTKDIERCVCALKKMNGDE